MRGMSDAPKKAKMVKTTITVAQGDLDLLRAAGKAFEGIKLSQVVRAALRVGIPALAKNPGLLWISVQPVSAAQRTDVVDVDSTPPPGSIPPPPPAPKPSGKPKK